MSSGPRLALYRSSFPMESNCATRLSYVFVEPGVRNCVSNSFFQFAGIIWMSIGNFNTSGNSLSVLSRKIFRSFSNFAIEAGRSEMCLTWFCFMMEFILSNVYISPTELNLTFRRRQDSNPCPGTDSTMPSASPVVTRRSMSCSFESASTACAQFHADKTLASTGESLPSFSVASKALRNPTSLAFVYAFTFLPHCLKFSARSPENCAGDMTLVSTRSYFVELAVDVTFLASTAI